MSQWVQVVELGGRSVRVLAVNHAPSVFSTLDGRGRLHNLTGLDVKVGGDFRNYQSIKFSPQCLKYLKILKKVINLTSCIQI